MKVSLITLGCKVSQYESDAIREELIALGYDAVAGFCDADFYVINTCAVTNEAERKSRNYITKVLNKNKNAKILVCGCASEHSAEQFLNSENVIYVCGNKGKNNISAFVDNYIKNQKDIENKRNFSEKLDLNYENFKKFTSSKTRAYLKIQDGCNNFCSYCLIPYVRGRSRSRELCEIVKEAEILSKTNHEIVLTGINMSDYRIDNKLSLGKVMASLSDVDARMRIGSLEVNIIDDEFLSVLKSMPNFCPQFHLSLQSGSDKILKLMNRHYDKTKFLEKVDLIRKYFPDAAITTDVIVGFPTETDEDFKESMETCKRANFFKMHIFPYSLRKGTRAEKLQQVNGAIKKQRVDILENLDNIMHENYLKFMEGKKQTVLTEELDDENYVIGHTENYIKVYMPKDTPLHSKVEIKVGKIFKDGVFGDKIN